jgi:hypothetical protein
MVLRVRKSEKKIFLSIIRHFFKFELHYKTKLFPIVYFRGLYVELGGFYQMQPILTAEAKFADFYQKVQKIKNIGVKSFAI